MKKCLIINALLAILFLSACGGKDDPTPTPPTPPAPDPDPAQMVVSTTTFPAEKGSGTIEVPVSANYNTIKVTVADAAKDWLFYQETQESKAELKSYKVILGYRANPLAKTREGNVTISLDELSSTITVTQAAADAVLTLTSASEDAIAVNPKGQQIDIAFTSNDEVNVTADAAWLTLKELKEGVATISAGVNGTDEPRTGTVTLSAKSNADVKAAVTFTQKAANVDPQAISILAIGNSFSQDATTYLYPILQELGYTKIRVANLYIGGCSLETHATNLKEDKAAYQLQYITSIAQEATDKMPAIKAGEWQNVDKFAASAALESDDWDFVTIQQVSGLSGQSSTYDPYLGEIIEAIRQYCPFTPIAWHMTWAYQGNSSHSDFAKYGKDQAEMYDSIVDAVKTKIVPNKEIEYIIPSGTAVQNLRTSFLGDNLTRDGYHMSYPIGRPLTALMWAKTLTGKDIDAVKFVPESYVYQDYYLPAMKEAVNNAAAKPLEVTNATSYPVRVSRMADESAFESTINNAGYAYDNYVYQPVTIYHNAFYNSESSATIKCGWAGATTDSSDAAQLPKFAATRIFSKSQLPVGTLIVVLSGYQYRPDAWVNSSTLNSSTTTPRPGNITKAVTEVTDAWWGTFTLRAFNIAKSGAPALSDAQQDELDSCFGIFIPKTAIGIGGLQDYGDGQWNW